MSQQYFYKYMDAEYGPFSAKELMEMIDSGSLSPGALIRNANDDIWKNVSQVRFIKKKTPKPLDVRQVPYPSQEGPSTNTHKSHSPTLPDPEWELDDDCEDQFEQQARLQKEFLRLFEKVRIGKDVDEEKSDFSSLWNHHKLCKSVLTLNSKVCSEFPPVMTKSVRKFSTDLGESLFHNEEISCAVSGYYRSLTFFEKKKKRSSAWVEILSEFVGSAFAEILGYGVLIFVPIYLIVKALDRSFGYFIVSPNRMVFIQFKRLSKNPKTKKRYWFARWQIHAVYTVHNEDLWKIEVSELMKQTNIEINEGNYLIAVAGGSTTQAFKKLNARDLYFGHLDLHFRFRISPMKIVATWILSVCIVIVVLSLLLQ